MKSLFLIVLTCLGADAAFLFSNRKIDCKVSYWSEWTGPVAFGTKERYRTVLAYPANGGQPCPSLTESTPASRAPTVKETAQKLVAKFLRRTNSTRSTRSNHETRDLLVLLDGSGSIGPSDFRKALKDLADLLGMLCPTDPFSSGDITKHQAAMIKFSSSVNEEFFFGQKYPTSMLQSAIRNVTYFGGGTDTGQAFKEALKMFRSTNKGVRNDPRVQKEVLILTDGMSNNGLEAIAAAKALKDATFSSANFNVNVFGLMIGTQTPAGQTEMMQYVSPPVGDHLFSVSGFTDLTSLVDEVRNQTSTAMMCAPIVNG